MAKQKQQQRFSSEAASVEGGPCNSLLAKQRPHVRAAISDIILLATSAVAIAQPLLRKVFFRDHLPIIHNVFTICIMMGFSGSSTALFLRNNNRPNLTRIFHYFSIVSIVTATAILVYVSLKQTDSR